MTVLSTRLVEIEACNFLGFLGLLVLIVSFAIGLSLFLEGHVFCALTCFLFIAFGSLMIKHGMYVKEAYYEYKVIIDDNISFNEVMHKYEILNQEGSIYTLKERASYEHQDKNMGQEK